MSRRAEPTRGPRCCALAQAVAGRATALTAPAVAERELEAIRRLVEAPSEAGRPVLEAYVQKNGEDRVRIDAEAHALEVPQVAPVRAALGGVEAAPVEPEPAVSAAPGSGAAGVSAQGLCDLAGNVWEWVADAYGPYGEAPTDGSARRKSTGLRVIRGGSWDDPARALRAALRDGRAPEDRESDLGFRVARDDPR